ncbi:MAG: hypothetical protein ACRDYY_07250 [Acidimicrobiales bacterium]
MEPWALPVRLRHEPADVHRLTIKSGSPADGRPIDDLADLRCDAWISLIVRGGELVAVKGGPPQEWRQTRGIRSQEVETKMPIAEQVALDVRDITLIEAGGSELSLGALGGAQVVVLLRHRH